MAKVSSNTGWGGDGDSVPKYGSKSGGLLEGLKTRSPEPDDASTKCKGGHVDSSVDRPSGAAPSPKTLGPREA